MYYVVKTYKFCKLTDDKFLSKTDQNPIALKFFISLNVSNWIPTRLITASTPYVN